MIMNVAYHRLLKPQHVKDNYLSEYVRRFLKLNFTNRGIDAVNVMKKNPVVYSIIFLIQGYILYFVEMYSNFLITKKLSS